MLIRKLASTNAFVAVDLADAPGHGVVRCAPKILQGGAKDLARATTYALATLERQETGISAGINAEANDRDAAVAAFTHEVTDWDAGYYLTAAKGVEAASLGAIEEAHDAALLAAGVVAAGLAAGPPHPGRPQGVHLVGDATPTTSGDLLDPVGHTEGGRHGGPG